MMTMTLLVPKGGEGLEDLEGLEDGMMTESNTKGDESRICCYSEL